MPEGFHPFPSRTRKLRPPGPRILGAQAPGKVGHRQVTNEKTISDEMVFSVFYSKSKGSAFHPFGSTLQEYAFRDAMWRKSHPTFVTLQEFAFRDAVWRKARPLRIPNTEVRIHTAGVCVISRSVAKGSFAFRSRAANTWWRQASSISCMNLELPKLFSI
jgi:hypothetical protein